MSENDANIVALLLGMLIGGELLIAYYLVKLYYKVGRLYDIINSLTATDSSKEQL